MLPASGKPNKNWWRWLIFLKIRKNTWISEREFLGAYCFWARREPARLYWRARSREKLASPFSIFPLPNLWRCLWEWARPEPETLSPPLKNPLPPFYLLTKLTRSGVKGGRDWEVGTTNGNRLSIKYWLRWMVLTETQRWWCLPRLTDRMFWIPRY